MMWSKNLAGLWLSALTFFIGFFEPRIVGAFTPRTNADLLRQENIAETQQRVMEKWTVLPIPELNARPFKFGAYLFLGTNSGDVYRSLDDGQTWEKVDSGIPDGALVNQFMAVGEVIFAGTYHKGLFRSTDLGNNWVAVNSGLEYSTGSSTAVRRIMMMAAFKSTLFAATDSVSQYNVRASIFRSTDLGQTWVEVNSGLPEQITQISIAASGSNIFAVTKLGIFRSSDLGQTWIPLNFGSGVIVSGPDIFTIISDEIWRSSNQGDSWTKVYDQSPSPDGNVQVGLTANGNYLFFLRSRLIG